MAASARRRVFAGNWKMHKTRAEAVALVRALDEQLGAETSCDLIVAPPATAIATVAEALAKSVIKVAAQDLHYEDNGAFTGALSGPMLREAGASYVIVAHSERRQLFGETLESSGKRLGAALRCRLVPIFCIGETLAERQAGRTREIVLSQLAAGLQGQSVEALAQVIIAYEPVWAIGTGVVATPNQAEEVHGWIRAELEKRALGHLRILYGGSVKPDNARELMAMPNIDGALVGGASLDAKSFVGIAKS